MITSDLHPSRHPGYSRNLHRWLMQFGGPAKAPIEHKVYRVTARSLLHRRYHFAVGELFIGRPYADPPMADDFSGAQLMHVLCLGGQALSMCYLGGMAGLECIEDFWDRYRVAGRCAIDTDHTTHFLDDKDRFDDTGHQRICRWCRGEVQSSPKAA